MSAPVLIMAGGTGGHIFPGIAVAQALQARNVPVLWLGSANGLETRLVPEAGIELQTLAIAGVRGKGSLTMLLAPLRIMRAMIAAWRLLGRIRPRCALALGGFAAGPGGIAAWLRRVPLLVHEQNRIPGATNRILARFARRRLCGFEGAFDNALWVGNPVRADIAALDPPARRWADRSGALRILILGGSQGAQSLNRDVPAMLRTRAGNAPLLVRHQCGARHEELTRSAYRAAEINAEVMAFERDMAGAYAWADLVICRAGALTLAELAAAGVASILVPFPHAVDDHQTRNAQALVQAGAARLVAEGDGFGERMGEAFVTIRDRGTLLVMAEAARTLARPDAAGRIADLCLLEAR